MSENGKGFFIDLNTETDEVQITAFGYDGDSCVEATRDIFNEFEGAAITRTDQIRNVDQQQVNQQKINN